MLKKIGLLILLFNLYSCTEKELHLSHVEEISLAEATYLPKNKQKTSDFKVQTFVHQKLQNESTIQLKHMMVQCHAEYGCVVIMDVRTGEVHAMVNLQESSIGGYKTEKNVAVNQYIDPGSFMKTFDVMALFEDKKSTTTQIYPSTGGKITMSGLIIKDAKEGGFGVQTLGTGLANSSNTIFAKAISSSYKKESSKFISRLEHCFNLSDLELPFKLNSKPYIPKVNSDDWCDITLAWLSIGYGLKLSPIQILSYYNAIANNGQFVQPRFISMIKKSNGAKKSYTLKPSHRKICSKNTSLKLKLYLRNALLKGNGQSFNSSKIALAGKTTLTSIYHDDASLKYVSGFVGYFPHHKPKYSIIALLGNVPFPTPNLAGEIARKIAESTLN